MTCSNQFTIAGHGTGNGILHNSIYSNGTSGIELMPGANNDQAAPVITSVLANSQIVQINGTLTSTPNNTFTVEFFASATNDRSGKIFLGSTTVKTDKNCTGTFTFLSALPSIVGSTYYTATATDSNNNTSDFSAGAS